MIEIQIAEEIHPKDLDKLSERLGLKIAFFEDYKLAQGPVKILLMAETTQQRKRMPVLSASESSLRTMYGKVSGPCRKRSDLSTETTGCCLVTMPPVTGDFCHHNGRARIPPAVASSLN